MRYFIIVLYGLILGSFLNVCIYRIPNERSIIVPRSHCINCKRNIKWYDLIPIISYLWLRGRCRYCKSKISIQYLFVELLTPLIFIFIYNSFGLSFYFFKYIIFISFLIVISLIDLKTTDIYMITTIPGIIVALAFAIIENLIYKDGIYNYIFGSLVASLIIFIIVYLTEGMGKGDIEIFALVGMFVGVKVSILIILLSFVLGGLVAGTLVVTKIKNRQDYVAFAPFIASASLLSIFWGNRIIDLYFTYFKLL
ncbi:prepilin peptidase [Desnuesiella massiliensis]|uniref:prepilin peptidase n=1 Tax=Desnuesiella massiliensis TaxID=1650662 RepID=UPI000A3DD7C6|nr:A24 family peptidase [Desnuesiella massiliensis]